MLVDGTPWLDNLKTSEKFLRQSDLNVKAELSFFSYVSDRKTRQTARKGITCSI